MIDTKSHIRLHQKGFTAVELLVTIFVAALFLAAGYQLYNVTLKSSAEGRDQADASLVASNYLNAHRNAVTNPCTTSTPLSNTPISAANLARPTVTVIISCPIASAGSVSKIETTVSYGRPDNRKTVKRTLFVNGI